jgi:hypothetical protein
MGRINTKSVVVGGLLAGLVINISETILNMPVLGADLEATLRSLSLPPVGGGAIGIFVLGGFGLGVLLVWLYAGMRPRFGAGPSTAIKAAVAVWLLAYVWPSLGLGLMGFMPARLLTIAVFWGLIEVILAALIGGWCYKEA